MHAGRDKTWAEIDRKYYGITKKEVAVLLDHCTTWAKTRSANTAAPLEAIVVKELLERLQIDLIDFSHLGQKFKWCLHVWDHFSKFTAAFPMESKESENVVLHLGGFIGIFGVPGIQQCDNGTEIKGACDQLVKHHCIPVVHSNPRTPQTIGLIEQANGVLKSKILAWMTEMKSIEWWLALPEAMLSMNWHVQSTTGQSPYKAVFKQLMPYRPLISPAKRSTAVVVGNAESHQEIEPSINPQLQVSGNIPEVTQHHPASEMQSQATLDLNKEVIANTQREVSAMETRYNNINTVEVFEKGDLVCLKIPVKDRFSTDNKRIFCKVVEVKHGNHYGLQCQYGILQGFCYTKNMDRLTVTIPHEIQTIKKGSHCMLSFWEAACLQSPGKHMQVPCQCNGNCNTIHCKCFKAKVECTLHCHGQNDGVKCKNNGVSAAPSGTFHLKRKTTPRPIHNNNQMRLRANTQ